MKKLLIATILLFSFANCLFAQTGTAGEALSPYESFMCEYNKSVVSSHQKLTLMYKKSNLKKLGKETANGTFGGTLFYNAKVRGFSGVVVMEYTGYSDRPGWILSGNTNTKANASANGKMFGTVTCHDGQGNFLGSVNYDKIIIKKANAAGGYYTVTLADGTSGKVAYDSIPPEEIESDDSEINAVLNSEEKHE